MKSNNKMHSMSERVRVSPHELCMHAYGALNNNNASHQSPHKQLMA